MLIRGKKVPYVPNKNFFNFILALELHDYELQAEHQTA